MTHAERVSQLTAELNQLERSIAATHVSIADLESQLFASERRKREIEEELRAHVTWVEVGKIDRKAADILMESFAKLGKTVRLTHLDRNRSMGVCRIEERVIR